MSKSKNDKISQSMMGNKNAEKWTLEACKEVLQKAIEMADIEEEVTVMKGRDKEIIIARKYDFIGEIASDLGYYKSLFTDLCNKFAELQPTYNQLVERLEANCFRNSKKGCIREATAIVNLKSNHGWTDRVDNTTKGKAINPPSWSETS